MIEQAIKAVEALTVRAMAPQLIYEDSELKKFIVNGQVATVDLGPAYRKHSVSSLGDLIALANRFGENGRSPVVWYNENIVTLVIDDEDYRVNTVEFALRSSDVFNRLSQLRQSPTWHKQKDFIRLLRIDLAGTLAPGILLDPVRRVKFENGTTTQGVVTRQQESLGHTITSKHDLTIPEDVRLEVSVYKSLGERDTYSLACAVEIDPGMGTLQLLPMPDEIERVQQLAVMSIGDRLREGLTEGIPCYYGTP